MKRRDFIKYSAVGAAAASIPSFSAAAPVVPTGRIIGPDGKINIACVGCGGKGASDVQGVSSENIVALCDVDFQKAAGTFKKYPNVPRFRDFRDMLISLDQQIDAVTVSTPDHMHFPIAMMAIEMGKHVFVQKPLAHTLEEARLLTEAARRHKVATQMGIQGHTMEGIRLLREWLDADAIGPVRELHIWTNRPIWPQGLDRPTDTQSPPATLDWNRWLGVAPERPYHSAYCPFKWRGWWDFGCGALGDIGCHAFDATFWALELGPPTSVQAEVSGHNPETAPKGSTVTYQFPPRNGKPPVKLVWYDGDRKPPRPSDLEDERKLPDGIGGQLIVGDTGTIMASDVYCRSLRLIPESKMKAFERPEKTLPRSPGVYQEWLDACRGKGIPGASFDYAGPLTEMVLLGNLAVRTGKRIEWDAANLRCTNVPEANALVRKKYRVF